jgi:hypothetical protein
MADVVMAVEIEFTRKRQIRGDFQITGATQDSIMYIDVILLDRLVAFIKALVFSGLFC